MAGKVKDQTLSGEQKEHRAAPEKRGRSWPRDALLIAITGFILLLLTGGIAYLVQGATAREELAEGVLVDGVREFRITATQWNLSPASLKVNPGDTVRFVVTSQDIGHGLAINELGVNLALSSGVEMAQEVLIPRDLPEGIYSMYCSIFCGIGHPNMKGTLTVGTPKLFLGVGMAKILPYGATAIMAGMFAAFAVVGRRRTR